MTENITILTKKCSDLIHEVETLKNELDNRQKNLSSPLKIATQMSHISDTFPANSKILPRWRYCNDIDELFNKNSLSVLARHTQLEARSMNAFLSRVRSFPENWPFSEHLNPFDLAGYGWKFISKNIIQCVEDVNRTLLICTEKTRLTDLSLQLNIKGCTFSYKHCPIEEYNQVINYHTTMALFPEIFQEF